MNPSTQIPHKPNRLFKFEKSRQFFIRVHNETLSVALRDNNENISPF
jgi:hypothetical protein